MKLFLLLTALLLVCPLSFAQNQDLISSDWSDLWGPPGSQSVLASCHTYAAMGLVEAEYARQFGDKADFSEAHIFVRYVLGGTKKEADRFIAEAFKRGLWDTESLEAGWSSEDFVQIRKYGLVTEADSPYAWAEKLFDILNRSLKTSGRSPASALQNFWQEAEGVETRLYAPKKLVANEWLQKLGYHFQRVSAADRLNREELGKNLAKLVACRPLVVSVHGEFRKNADYRGPHSEILAGYDAKRGVFLLRNSWGIAHTGTYYESIPEKELLGDVYGLGWIENPDLKCLGRSSGI